MNTSRLLFVLLVATVVGSVSFAQEEKEAQNPIEQIKGIIAMAKAKDIYVKKDDIFVRETEEAFNLFVSYQPPKEAEEISNKHKGEARAVYYSCRRILFHYARFQGKNYPDVTLALNEATLELFDMAIEKLKWIDKRMVGTDYSRAYEQIRIWRIQISFGLLPPPIIVSDYDSSALSRQISRQFEF